MRRRLLDLFKSNDKSRKAEKIEDLSETSVQLSNDKTDVHASGGRRKLQGNPIYSPRPGKLKGYMKEKSYKAKRR